MTVAVIVYIHDINNMINTVHMEARRHCLRLTQQALAEKVGITKDHICRIENGRVSPRLSTVLALCRELKTEPNKLIQWETSNGD